VLLCSTAMSAKGKEPAVKLEDDVALFDDKELDRIFNQEASLVSREQEVRTRSLHSLDPTR